MVQSNDQKRRTFLALIIVLCTAGGFFLYFKSSPKTYDAAYSEQQLNEQAPHQNNDVYEYRSAIETETERNFPKAGTSVEEYKKTLYPSEKEIESQRLKQAEFKNQEDEIYSKYLHYKTGDIYIPEMERLIENNISDVGYNHPYMADAYFHLGMMQYGEAKHQDGEKSFLTALQIFRNALGEGHEYTGMTYANLGHVTYSQGRYKDALNYYQKSYDNLSKKDLRHKQDLQRVATMIKKTKNKIKEMK